MGEMDANLLAETENYMVWTSEVEAETLFHIELAGTTLHLLSEEWEEFITLIKMVLDG